MTATFAKVAKGLKVNDPAKFSDLVKLAAYQPEGDEPDEVKIATAFQEALKGRPWLADPDTSTTAAGAAKTASGGATGATQAQPGGKPGVGAERGQSVTSESSSASTHPDSRELQYCEIGGLLNAHGEQLSRFQFRSLVRTARHQA